MATRLLAVDLDGTLYRADGTLSPWDLDAVAKARASGLDVTIATGRIALGALPAAKAMGLTTPLVCAEGAVIVDPVTGETLTRRAMAEHHVVDLTDAAGEHGLASFWFLHDEIHGEAHGEAHVRYIGTWSPAITLHTRLPDSHAWDRRTDVTMAVAIGHAEGVKAAHARAESQHGEHLMTVRFPITADRETWCLLVRSARHDKATGLAEVTAQRGIAPHEVAVVGDWVNDIPMFRWAGRSFAMGQSPDHVAEHATERLTATHHTGGGVAEAILKILREG